MADNDKRADLDEERDAPAVPADADAAPPADDDELGMPPALTADGLDPELVKLPRTRTHIGPLMALSVLVFCGYMMLRLYPDLLFWRSDAAPRDYPSAAALLESAEAEDFVRVLAVPDRSFVTHVSHSQAEHGSRLMPMLGTQGRLWLMQGGNPAAIDPPIREVYTGRLRPMDDLPLDGPVRAHVRERGPEPRFVTPAALRQAVEAQASQVVEPAGDVIQVAPATPVHLYETVADQVRLQFFVSERMQSDRDMNEALIAAGLLAPGHAPPEPGPGKSWVYTLTIPGGADAVHERLAAAKIFSASASPIKRVHDTTWGQLSTQGPDIVRLGDITLPWTSVTWIALDVPRAVPADALVLVTGEEPEAYWYVPWVFGLLALAALFFLYTLARSLVPRR